MRLLLIIALVIAIVIIIVITIITLQPSTLLYAMALKNLKTDMLNKNLTLIMNEQIQITMPTQNAIIKVLVKYSLNIPNYQYYIQYVQYHMNNATVKYTGGFFAWTDSQLLIERV